MLAVNKSESMILYDMMRNADEPELIKDVSRVFVEGGHDVYVIAKAPNLCDESTHLVARYQNGEMALQCMADIEQLLRWPHSKFRYTEYRCPDPSEM